MGVVARCLIAVLVSLAAGCGSSSKDTSGPAPGSGSGSGSGSASQPAPVIPDAVPRGSSEEPTRPPPPPLIKPGPGDCKTEYAPRPTRDPNPMCKIGGGTFEMGDPKGKHVTVELSPYALDQFEVTNAQMLLFFESTHADQKCKDCFIFPLAPPPPVTRTGDGHYAIVDPKMARWPFNLANRRGAAMYCEWAGKVLPTEAQWELAARHDPVSKKDRAYPWGNAFDPRRARCECDGVASMEKSLDPVDVGSYDGTHGFGDGRSPWGLHDLVGNATEIVADCVHDLTPCAGPCRDPIGRSGDTDCLPAARGGGAATGIPETWSSSVLSGGGGIRCAVSLVKR